MSPREQVQTARLYGNGLALERASTLAISISMIPVHCLPPIYSRLTRVFGFIKCRVLPVELPPGVENLYRSPI